MDVSMLDAAGQALLAILEPYRLLVLTTGALLGLILGILPGIGGIAGTALLLPFTFSMDPYTAFAFLLGLGSTTATGDPIPAILFGVPGGAGSAATVQDGVPMAKRGEASRALSAAYMSSLLGGLFGAALMGFTIPMIRPIMLHIGSPELLALGVFGISMVAVLSGNAPLRGIAMAGLGLMFAMVGADSQTGTMRWTFGTLYLWQGLPLVPFVLGIFALPELCDLAISRLSFSKGAGKIDVRSGQWQGAKDCFRHIWLIIRCSWIGAGLGAIPGIGGSIIDWLAYGHALRTEKGAEQSFGRGDVRGVIASESSNNAKEGGALIPTVAFGVPGSAGMAVLLGAFLMHGLVPGPDMLTKNLDLTYSMVWSIAIANIVGAGLCYLMSGYFAMVAMLRYTLILPAVLCIIYIGAYEGSRNWGDLYALLIFGVLGWIMKQLRWPRPPLILGFVLGSLLERYLFISVNRYGAEWLTRPAVIALLALAIFGLLRPLIADVRRTGFSTLTSGFGRPRFDLTLLFPVFIICLIGAMLIQASGWRWQAMIIPAIIGSIVLAFAGASLLVQLFYRPQPVPEGSPQASQMRIHMDLVADTDHLPAKVVAARAAQFFGWLIGFMISMALIGTVLTIPIFVTAYMRLENREPWKIVIAQAVCITLFVFILFDQLLNILWPQTLLGQLFPALRFLPAV